MVAMIVFGILHLQNTKCLLTVSINISISNENEIEILTENGVLYSFMMNIESVSIETRKLYPR